MKFKELLIGDVFNTQSGRWAKYYNDRAVCILSSLYATGDIITLHPDCDVIVSTI